MPMWPFKRNKAPEEHILTPEEAWQLRKTPASRAERRRQAKEVQSSLSLRVCFRCGFGAVKGIANSNLVRAKTNDGEDGWIHSSPVVCAGYVRAITSQARSTIPAALKDLLLVTGLKVEAWFTSQRASLKHFLRDDGGAGMNTVGGNPQRIRGNTQRKAS